LTHPTPAPPHPTSSTLPHPRAPECLLTDGYYNYKMDMWGVGCVMFEVVALFPLFPGTNELDQVGRSSRRLPEGRAAWVRRRHPRFPVAGPLD
jgi:serine/threonine protein kinase